MQATERYALGRLNGIAYLLPYGQAVADRSRAVKLDDQGAELWGRIVAGEGAESVLDGAKDDDEKETLSAFVDGLRSVGVLRMQEDPAVPAPVKVALIAGLRIGFSGRVSYLAPEFDPFFVDDMDSPCDQTVLIARSEPPALAGATVVIQTKELVVLDAKENWVLNFRTHPQLLAGVVSKDGSFARFYVADPAASEKDGLAEELFHAIRFAFLVVAQQRDRYVLHSCSVRYRDSALLFSGSSGTGKSTHAELWHRGFGVPYLNGDLNVLHMQDSQPRVCGLPWCGTSGISELFDLPLAGVVLLRQAPRNQVQELAQDEKQLFLMNRFISPTWNEVLLERSLGFSGAYSSSAHICRYLCTKDPAAAEVLKSWVDAQLDCSKV